jgi:hypothetical protein
VGVQLEEAGMETGNFEMKGVVVFVAGYRGGLTHSLMHQNQ